MRQESALCHSVFPPPLRWIVPFSLLPSVTAACPLVTSPLTAPLLSPCNDSTNVYNMAGAPQSSHRRALHVEQRGLVRFSFHLRQILRWAAPTSTELVAGSQLGCVQKYIGERDAVGRMFDRHV